jgi:hypothetical protein
MFEGKEELPTSDDAIKESDLCVLLPLLILRPYICEVLRTAVFSMCFHAVKQYFTTPERRRAEAAAVQGRSRYQFGPVRQLSWDFRGFT